MLAPDSGWTVALLVVVSVGMLVGVALAGMRWRAVPAAAGAVLAAVLAGAVWVNVSYGYYQHWSDAVADLTGALPAAGSPAAPVQLPPAGSSSGRAGAPSAARPGLGTVRGHGRLVQTWLGGPISGLRRRALVWLPPQYLDPAFATQKFPVMMLLHGDPGEARGFIYGMHVDAVADELVRAGRMSPVVIVMPTVWVGWHGQQCLDATRGPADETYLTRDVVGAVTAGFRVFAPGPAWAIAGLSEGGYCAVNLALRHPSLFAGAASLDGYYAPDVSRGLGRRLFGGDGAAQAAATPLSVVSTWPTPRAPAMWLMAGDQDKGDVGQLRAFASAADTVCQERIVIVHGGRHTTPAWRAALPDLLTWAGGLVGQGVASSGTLTVSL
ncbi:MAG: alpha/beta hydrolase-fold protein [Mycobacteriales bacterium]